MTWLEDEVSFWVLAYFQGQAVSFREGNHHAPQTSNVVGKIENIPQMVF